MFHTGVVPRDSTPDVENSSLLGLRLGPAMKLESLIQYSDELLGVEDHPDYPTALNGLQVDGAPGRTVRRIAAAVDASEAVIDAAVEAEADLLIVHHGLFWSGLRPITGRRYRKLGQLVDAGLAVYSVHLPLDGHPELGNCALLARALGLRMEGRFGEYKGAPLGWWGVAPGGWSPDELEARAAAAVHGPARRLGSGPDPVHRVGVVTGSGATFLEDAADAGLDALVTGEAAHHTFTDAHELGLHLVLAGHYATETFGVKALAAHLAERFDLSWTFLDHPSGI